MSDVLLFSGGIDSVSAWFYMGKPKCVYVDMMTKYSPKELICIEELEKIIPDFKVEIIKGINLGQFEEGVNAFIPNRNLILASLANNYGSRIILAGIEDDNVCDKNPKAFGKMSECLTEINTVGNIEVFSPFWNMSKINIIRWMLDNVRDAEKILRTSVSCYSRDKGQCGNCPSCMRKAIAFEMCGLDIGFFNNDVTKSNLIKVYEDKFSKENNYTQERIDNTIEVFKKWKSKKR